MLSQTGTTRLKFLPEIEGATCDMCPEVSHRELPEAACAKEVDAHDNSIRISCQPLPELCAEELRQRYGANDVTAKTNSKKAENLRLPSLLAVTATDQSDTLPISESFQSTSPPTTSLEWSRSIKVPLRTSGASPSTGLFTVSGQNVTASLQSLTTAEFNFAFKAVDNSHTTTFHDLSTSPSITDQKQLAGNILSTKTTHALPIVSFITKSWAKTENVANTIEFSKKTEPKKKKGNTKQFPELETTTLVFDYSEDKSYSNQSYFNSSIDYSSTTRSIGNISINIFGNITLIPFWTEQMFFNNFIPTTLSTAVANTTFTSQVTNIVKATVDSEYHNITKLTSKSATSLLPLVNYPIKVRKTSLFASTTDVVKSSAKMVSSQITPKNSFVSTTRFLQPTAITTEIKPKLFSSIESSTIEVITAKQRSISANPITSTMISSTLVKKDLNHMAKPIGGAESHNSNHLPGEVTYKLRLYNGIKKDETLLYQKQIINHMNDGQGQLKPLKEETFQSSALTSSSPTAIASSTTANKLQATVASTPQKHNLKIITGLPFIPNQYFYEALTTNYNLHQDISTRESELNKKSIGVSTHNYSRIKFSDSNQKINKEVVYSGTTDGRIYVKHKNSEAFNHSIVSKDSLQQSKRTHPASKSKKDEWSGKNKSILVSLLTLPTSHTTATHLPQYYVSIPTKSYQVASNKKYTNDHIKSLTQKPYLRAKVRNFGKKQLHDVYNITKPNYEVQTDSRNVFFINDQFGNINHILPLILRPPKSRRLSTTRMNEPGRSAFTTSIETVQDSSMKTGLARNGLNLHSDSRNMYKRKNSGENLTMETIKCERCLDKHKLCCFWALLGECDKNPYWMQIHCAQSCGTCTLKLKKCVSTDVRCLLSTAQVASEPTSSSATVLNFANILNLPNRSTIEFSKEKKSNFISSQDSASLRATTTLPPMVKIIDEITPTKAKMKLCLDYSIHCKFWADLGECIRNPFWMMPNCQKSCFTCGKVFSKVYEPTLRKGCTNHNKYCQFWAFSGQCDMNPNWMKRYCPLSFVQKKKQGNSRMEEIVLIMTASVDGFLELRGRGHFFLCSAPFTF
ncbi:unnamed protein product [Thelazia callipaeda]|uniref:ShKT domain-containing protein n=1 Tax=Thelazia callipaeda TaxID=103827 RepID=A0A0N5CUT6_THECL|nr:unnamed protein product [Thelazia callipaeda]